MWRKVLTLQDVYDYKLRIPCLLGNADKRQARRIADVTVSGMGAVNTKNSGPEAYQESILAKRGL